MGFERYVVDAVVIEKRRPSEIAQAHGISRSWLYELIARVRAGGYPALEAQSRRPRSSPRAVTAPVVASILQLRQELLTAGHDAGPRPSPITSPHAGARLLPPAPASGASSIATA